MRDRVNERMIHRFLLVVGLVVASAVVSAQRSQLESFDVASVKPQTRLLGGGSRSGIRYYEPGTTLRKVIEFAYELTPVRIGGGPPWIDSDFWEIDARAPRPATVEEMRAMVKGLLNERFQLKIRIETRELPLYDLRVARSDGRLGPNATPAGECTRLGTRSIQSLGAGEIACGSLTPIGIGPDGSISFDLFSVTISAFAGHLERFTDRVIRNGTDIDGEFDITLRYSRPEMSVQFPGRAARRPLAPALPVALQEQLGLRLEASKGLVDVLVIESVARPSPN